MRAKVHQKAFLVHFIKMIKRFHTFEDFSPKNPNLKLVQYNSKPQLMDGHAIFSGGMLENYFKTVFKSTLSKKNSAGRTLIIGFGMGATASALNGYQPTEIIGVEYDKEILDLFQHYESSMPAVGIELFLADGANWIISNAGKEKFDTIIIDVFQNHQVPKDFQTEEFYVHLNGALTKNGTLIWNWSKSSPKKILSLNHRFGFFDFKIKHFYGDNLVLIHQSF